MALKMILEHAIPILAKDLKAQSILLYGSYAQNCRDQYSDLDLLVLVKKIPTPASRQRAYNKILDSQILEIDLKHEQIKNGWDNSWSPTNDKLLISNHRVEIGYNTLTWVNKVVEKLLVKHQITFKEFPFRPYTFLGLLDTCKVLYDETNYIKELISRIKPIPQPLKQKIVQEFFPILFEAHEELKDYSKRNIGILGYQFHLFRGVDALMQLLFVLNEVYDPALKRIEPFLLKLKKLPPKFEEFIFKILPRFYEKQKEVSEFFEKAIQYIREAGLIFD